MKKLQAIVFALSLLLVSAGQNPIKDSYLQNDLDANAKAITDVKNQAPTDVWITHDRSDGKGRGTQLDPYDGSTRIKLDALWPKLVNGTAIGLSSPPAKVTFAPSTSTYLTNGELYPISNCVISYKGATIKLDVGAAVSDAKRGVFDTGAGGTIRNCIFDGGGTGIIDCNGANQTTTTNICLFGINVWGSNCKILRTKFVGWCTTNVSAEAFASAFFAPASGATGGNEIAHNEYTAPAALTNTGPITLYCVHGDDRGTSGYPGPRWTYGDEIHHNYTHDVSATAGALQAGQVGSGSVGQSFHDNLTVNFGGQAVHSDSGNTWNAVVRHNTGINVQRGIIIVPSLENATGNGHTWNNLTVEDNNMMITPGDPSYGYIVDEGPFPGLTYRNNRVDRYGGSGDVEVGFLFRYVSNGKLEHNTATANITEPVVVGHSTDSAISYNTSTEIEDEGTNTNLHRRENFDLAGARLDAATDRSDIGIYKVTQTIVSPSSTITFSGIPSGYKRLRLTTSLRGSGSDGRVSVKIRFNGDNTSNYAWNMNKAFSTNSFSNDGGSVADTGIAIIKISDAACPGGEAGVYDFIIASYDDSSFAKVIAGQGMYYDAAAAGTRENGAGIWFNSVPITEASLTIETGNFVTNSTATLSGD